MKSRILENGLFGGIYTNEFLEKNNNNIINGEVVSDWNLSDVECSTELVIPIFDNGNWIESATTEEIAIFNTIEQNSVRLDAEALNDSMNQILDEEGNNINNIK